MGEGPHATCVCPVVGECVHVAAHPHSQSVSSHSAESLARDVARKQELDFWHARIAQLEKFFKTVAAKEA